MQSNNWEANLIERPGEIRAILQQSRTIAVVGMKDSPREPAFYVPEYLHRQGYRIVPVNPNFDHILGERCLPSLLEINEKVDLVQLFRASHNVMPHALEALRLSPRVFWMQDGIKNSEAARTLAQVGILVVQDRCMLRDHIQLIGGQGAGRRHE